MKRASARNLASAVLILGAFLGAAAPGLVQAATPDPDESVIFVRKDCATTGPAANNCFTTIASALSWTWGTRVPSETSPLEIRIGPGEWPEQFSCANNGWVSVRGSGREVTRILGTRTGGELYAASLQNCTDLEFSDLTFEHPDIAVRWQGGGNSTWTDTNLISLGGGSPYIQGAWADDLCDPANGVATHYFFGSRIRSRAEVKGLYPPFVFWSECADHWFYGGEIFWDVSGFGDTGGPIGTAEGAAILVGHDSSVKVFGASIVLEATAGAGKIKGDVVAVKTEDAFSALTGPQQFHMHGGIINITLDESVVPAHGHLSATSLWADSFNSLVHVLGTAFVLNVPDDISIYRSYATPGGAKLRSSFQWEARSLPPVSTTEANVLLTEDGQDSFVETDCNADGDCSGGSESHLMVYNASLCTDSANPWLDTITGRCRNDTTDPVADALADLDARVSALENP